MLRFTVTRTSLDPDLTLILHLPSQSCRHYFVKIQFPRRLSSNFFPWGGKYKIEDLPTYEGIKEALARAGMVARATGQRLTAHPSEFVKLAAPRPELVEESLGDLELHGSVRVLAHAVTPWVSGVARSADDCLLYTSRSTACARCHTLQSIGSVGCVGCLCWA